MAKKRNRNPATEEKSPATEKVQTNNDTHNEIDEIFAKAKKPKNVQGSNPRSTSATKSGKPDEQNIKSSSEASDKKKQKNGKGWPDPTPKPRRKTNDGFNVYAADELGFNKKDAGGTPLCPFDCDCCF